MVHERAEGILTGIPEALTNMGSGLWLGLPRNALRLAGVAC